MPSPSRPPVALVPKKAHFMLRYCAPLHDFDRNLRWVLQICKKASVGEVMFFIDAEEHFFGFPTFDRLRSWVEAFKTAKKALNKRGIIMSVNPWVTLGHSDRGYPPPKEIGLTATMVGDDGAVSSDTACPADPGWQRYIAESYALIASADPEILWMEDDYRLHNHGVVNFGCFAEPMLNAFAKRTKRRWERAALVEAIVQNKGRARRDWLKFTGDLWIENAARIQKAVHGANPRVKLGQMTSSMGAHAAEGRRWKEYLAALCGPHRPITRPNFGPYRQATGFDFAVGLSMFRHGLAFAGRETRCCPELENCPNSYYSKGRTQSQLMLELVQFFGCRDVTLDFYAFAGNDPKNEPWVIEQMNAARPRADALAALNLDRRVESGIHLWTSERAALFQNTDGYPIKMDSLCPTFDAWSRIFTRTGIASTFETAGALTAVAGDTIRAADETELRRLLSGGLLLDGRAAMALQEMGYGQYLGVSIKKRQVSGAAYILPIERILDEKFGLKGSPGMCCTQMGHNWRDCHVFMHDLDGARAVSEFRAGDQTPIGPAVTLFENAIGGRVAVFPYDFESGIPDSGRFFNHPRKCQLQAVVRWLNRGKAIIANPDMAEITVEHSAVNGTNVLTAINLNNDPVDTLTLELPAPPSAGKILLLNSKGKWVGSRAKSTSRGKVTVTLPKPLQPSEACFLKWGAA